jgi:hypothetical protein
MQWSRRDEDRGAVGNDACDLSDLRVRDRDATAGPVNQPMKATEETETVGEAVDHDEAARRHPASSSLTTVLGRRVGNVQCKVKGTPRVAVVDEVGAFRSAPIALTLLGANGYSAEGDAVGPNGSARALKSQCPRGLVNNNAVDACRDWKR